MVDEQGGLAAAKSLISVNQPSEKFTKPEYRDLFEPAEIKKCRGRLVAYKWSAEPPWLPPRAANRP
jgi:hypothetical protein